MKKQTISKIAAVALAAMTVVPMFGITASADVTFSEGNTNNGTFKQAWGTANQCKWQVTRTTVTTYEVAKNNSASTDVYNQYEFVKADPASGKTNPEVKIYNNEDKTVDSNFPVPNSTTKKTSLAPYGVVYYANNIDVLIPETDGKKVLDKAKKDAADDWSKYEKALKDWNTNIKNFNTAKKSAADAATKAGESYGTAQFTAADGKKYYVDNQTNGVYKTKLANGFLNDEESGFYTNYVDSYVNADIILSDGSTMNLTSSKTGIIKYEYAYTASMDSVPLSTVLSNLKASYIKRDNTNSNIIVEGTSGDYSVVNGGEVVPGQNPDGSSSSGVAKPGTGTNNPVNGLYYTDYLTTPTTTYCWYSTARPGYYYKDGTTAQYAAYYYTGVYGTAQKATVGHTCPDYSNTVSAAYPWVAGYPNRYYKTEADAKADAAYHGYSTTAINYYNSYYNPYSYLYGYGYGTTTNTVKDTSTVTIGNYKGWTYVTRYINNAKSGASYTVKMNSETEIPTNVLKALYGKNVTVNFKFNSGATLSIKGTDMASTSAISTNIRYVKNVPSALVSKAVKSNSGVSSAQFTVSGGSIGANASVTVKFSTSRSGKTATLYRYNASSNSLTKVSTSTVRSNGYCTLANVDKGGDYVIVLS